MKADRELDARIDAEMFGVERKLCTIHHAYSCCGRTTKHYSTQIADAWLVVEKLGGVVGIDRFPKYDDPDEWYWDVGFNKGTAQADTAPLAICLAALAVVERRER